MPRGNPTSGAERQRKYRAQNPERVKESQRKWRENNSEEVQKYNREWKRQNQKDYRNRQKTSLWRSIVGVWEREDEAGEQ